MSAGVADSSETPAEPSVGHYRVHALLTESTPFDSCGIVETVRHLVPESGGEVLTGGAVRLAWKDGAGRMDLGSIGAPPLTPDLDDAFSQTWDWPGAAHALEHTRGAVTLTEHGLPGDDRFVRVQRLCAVLRALLKHAPVAALLWEPAQRLVEPAAFIDSLAHGASVVDHAVNVRLFRITDGRPGEMLMDTLGLTPFGLPDLQCHFAGADPGRMGPVLASYAEYLFDRGDVLDESSLIRGIDSHQEWRCERTDSLAPPDRTVVDIRPDDLWVPA
jgi:hypothetical protein